jgi:hypothetical protein
MHAFDDVKAGAEIDPSDDLPTPIKETDGLEPAAEGADQDDDGSDVLEDVEYEGKIYQAPKALKGALMRHADYTRKTQELAAERRAAESERAWHAESQDTRTALAALQHKMAAVEQVDWPTLQREDPEAAEQLRLHAAALVEAHGHLTADLEARHAEHEALRQQAHAERLRDGHAVLSRDIEGWSPELAGRLAKFASSEFGVTPEELAEVHDPRLVKLLHAAYVAANAGRLNRQAQRHVDAQASRPAATVGGRAAAGKDPNRMSTEEWMRHRNSQLRRQR